MDSGQESNLTSILGNVSQSEKCFEIKLPLYLCHHQVLLAFMWWETNELWRGQITMRMLLAKNLFTWNMINILIVFLNKEDQKYGFYLSFNYV